MRLAGEELQPLVTLATFAIGIAGGLVAKWIGAPLPMLLGSVVSVGTFAILGLRAYGGPPKIPMWLRLVFLPIIGVSIGGAFTPAILADLASWWPTLLAVFVYVPVVHWLGYQEYKRLGRLEPRTAYYAAVPGGLIEVIAMGEEAGADPAMLAMLQFLRLILTILLVPLAFSLLEGGPVGSSSGAVLSKLDRPDAFDAAFLFVLGAAGFFGGRWIGMPAYVITGPILMSGVAHLLGLIETVPPSWLIEVTQLVVGVSLGTRFVGMELSLVWRALHLAFINILGTMVFAVVLALVLHGAVGQPTEAVTLAFAPGGLAEMALVAVSLEMSVVYVTAHHVVRIILSVSIAKMFARRVAGADATGRRTGSAGSAPPPGRQ
ncbi:AbrB family transcriptional regulator [Acuticoccus sp.]|uniref:AbrB family transcriptional regulator n=1 Tax=Acuticoccus sp. TaxID=1904378 RepID=UPI003B525138